MGSDPSLRITKRHARQFILRYQGLWPAARARGKSAVLDYIRRVGCVQYDPLNTVGHNHELVLQSRVDGFRSEMLTELLYDDRSLLDGWDKIMSIYPVEDWPYFLRRRQVCLDHYGSRDPAVSNAVPLVRNAIEERGPLSSKDLDLRQTVDWSWAPTRLARAAMESMFLWGELVVHHRVHTRKFYDLSRRHIPEGLFESADPNHSDEDYQDWYLLRRIGSVGLLWMKAGDAWLGIYDIKAKDRASSIERLMRRGAVREVAVEGLSLPFYLRSDDAPLLETDGGHGPKKSAILAPLDNALWDRKLIQAIFDFQYVWEVYKPSAERRYGYYVLPVLYGDRFVARFEPGMDRKSGVFTIRNWWWESGVKSSKAMTRSLAECFGRFLAFLGAESVSLDAAAAKVSDLHWLKSLITT